MADFYDIIRVYDNKRTEIRFENKTMVIAPDVDRDELALTCEKYDNNPNGIYGALEAQEFENFYNDVPETDEKGRKLITKATIGELNKLFAIGKPERVEKSLIAIFNRCYYSFNQDLTKILDTPPDSPKRRIKALEIAIEAEKIRVEFKKNKSDKKFSLKMASDNDENIKKLEGLIIQMLHKRAELNKLNPRLY